MKTEGVFSRTLMCRVIGMVPFMEGAIRMDFPKNNCCDMGGAIKIATTILPEVKHIYTFAGKEPDTEYHRRSSGEWVAI